MKKKIILTESQFKTYMRHLTTEGVEEQQPAQSEGRDLEIEEVDALLHRMIDDDFFLYFPTYGKRYCCAYLHEKAEIFDAVCTCHPRLNAEKYIVLRNANYGEFLMENLINAQ
jgi:hypothetical protein